MAEVGAAKSVLATAYAGGYLNSLIDKFITIAISQPSFPGDSNLSLTYSGGFFFTQSALNLK